VERSRLLRVNLRIEVRDRHGRIIEVREKESDLILDNFRDLLAAIFLPEFEWSKITAAWATAYEKYAALVDLGGVARSVPTYGGRTFASNGNWSINFSGIGGYNLIDAGRMGVRIRIGTSTIAPSRGDYKLGAEVANGVPTQTIGADYISWAISLVLAEAVDVSEAGMSIRCNYASVGSARAFAEFLLFRDTFTTVSVPAGGTLSVTYTLTL